MPSSPIPKTRRHLEDALVSNPRTPCHPKYVLLTNSDNTAPCPDQQSSRHGATERTARPAIPMAQRHPRETPSSNSHSTFNTLDAACCRVSTKVRLPRKTHVTARKIMCVHGAASTSAAHPRHIFQHVRSRSLPRDGAVPLELLDRSSRFGIAD